jgi:hypothetical protein
MADPLAYNTNLRADIKSSVGDDPKARVHSREWVKIMNGDPVEINPSVGFGYKVQTPAFLSAQLAEAMLAGMESHVYVVIAVSSFGFRLSKASSRCMTNLTVKA